MNFYKERKKILKLKEYNNQIFEKDKSRIWAREHKSQLLKKYNFCCADCGMKNSLKKPLHAHHIKYTKNIDDLILLCRECHIKEHRRIKNDL